ncbi:MAG: hypothetical protein RR356_07165 [Bacteroidales bacterium]
MKKKILVLCIAFIGLLSITNAQKCKYEYEKVDEISGKVSKAIVNTFADDMVLIFKNTDGVYSIDIKIIVGLGSDFSVLSNFPIHKGDSLVFKLSNNELITFYANKDVIPTSGQNSLVSIYLLYDDVYSISKEELTKLSTGEIIYLRQFIGKSEFSAKPKSKENIKFQQAINCLMQ